MLILGASIFTLSPYLIVVTIRYANGQVADDEQLFFSHAKKVSFR